MKTDYQIIKIHPSAPEKPAVGQPCNGCGVCCAAESCPVSLALLWPHQPACRALTWHETHQRYYCGMVINPKKHLVWLPTFANGLASRLLKRWIAADQSCDADFEWISH